jgi:hypothetical protein
MAAIANAMAAAEASIGSGTTLATATPTSAETTLPPIAGQGRANGLAGTANNRTAEAPIGATTNGSDVSNPPM